MTLPDRFARHLASLGLPGTTRVIAVSGGPDSMALLHLMAPLGPSGSLLVGHVDHGIHPDSARVADLVERAAARLGLPSLVARLELGPGASETAARAARYRALRTMAAERGALIFTAHHRDDQLETVLMRVLGGSGLAGLAAMAPISAGIVRPLLPFSRDEVLAWIREEGIEFWNDPANADPAHLRSWLRLTVLPQLTARIPDLDRRLARLARRARENRIAWDQALEVLGLEVRLEENGVSLLRQPLAALGSPLAALSIQAAVRRSGLRIGPAAAARLVSLVRGAESGQRADLGGGLLGEIVFERVVVRPGRTVPLWEAVSLAGDRGTVHLGPWTCRWRLEPAPAGQERRSQVAWVPAGDYQIRPWRPGDRISPLGGRGRRLVVRCMQEARVSRADRAGWPVLVSGDRIVWVPGVMRGSDALPAEGATVVRVEMSRD